MTTLLVVVNAPDLPIGSADSEQRIANREVHIDGSALGKRAVVGDVESSAMAHARQRDAHRTLRALERRGIAACRVLYRRHSGASRIGPATECSRSRALIVGVVPTSEQRRLCALA
jgi:hypothetical protein